MEYGCEFCKGTAKVIAEKTIEVLLKRHETLHAVMTPDGQMKVLSVNDCLQNGFHKIKVINASAKDLDLHRQNLREYMVENGPNTLKGPLFEVKLSVCNEERNKLEIPWGVFHISISLFVMDGRTERLLRNGGSNIFLSLWANNTP